MPSVIDIPEQASTVLPAPAPTQLQRAMSWPFPYRPGTARKLRNLLRADIVLLALVAVAMSVMSVADLNVPMFLSRVALALAFLLLVIDYGIDHWWKPGE